MNKVLVVGGINMDIVAETKKLPRKGETIHGRSLCYIPGGKGANQAVAASRLGANVSFIGKVGKDIFGNELLNFLKKEKLLIDGIRQVDGSSGVAIITVDQKGENTIVVTSGSNVQVTSEYVEQFEKRIQEVDIILAQYEIPIETVKTLFSIAKKHNKITVLNPAPACKTTQDLLANVDYLIVNEIELSFFTNSKLVQKKQDKIINAANELLKKGPKFIIITLGSKGSITVSKQGNLKIEGIHVKAVDTTAAGDCFVGALTAQLSSNVSLEKALKFANQAAALSVQRFGASTSLPFLKDISS
jgi:ribokinase